MPWNRGADPNFWSFVEQTPKGVTIHHIDEGLDTGDIIVQQIVNFHLDRETLSSSYHKLHISIQGLFKQNWNDIKMCRYSGEQQIGNGTVHKAIDREKMIDYMPDGWDTSISYVENYRPH